MKFSLLKSVDFMNKIETSGNPKCRGRVKKLKNLRVISKDGESSSKEDVMFHRK